MKSTLWDLKLNLNTQENDYISITYFQSVTNYKQMKKMTRQEIEKVTNEFLIEELEIAPDDLIPESKLRDDLGIDSLDFIDIVVIVERNFGFKIKPEEMIEVTTLGLFYDYIEINVNK